MVRRSILVIGTIAASVFILGLAYWARDVGDMFSVVSELEEESVNTRHVALSGALSIGESDATVLVPHHNNKRSKQPHSKAVRSRDTLPQRHSEPSVPLAVANPVHSATPSVVEPSKKKERKPYQATAVGEDELKTIVEVEQLTAHTAFAHFFTEFSDLESATAEESTPHAPTAETVDFPLAVFLKFHKVGGTTIETCLRARENTFVMNHHVPGYWCCDKLLEQDGTMKRPGFKDRNNTGSITQDCRSQGRGYSHNTLALYKEHGMEGYKTCVSFYDVFRSSPLKVFTILRDPVERFISAMYYYGKVYTNPYGRLCLARKLYEDVRFDIHDAYERLTTSPSNVTEKDVDLMGMCVFGDAHDKWKQRTYPGPPAGAPSMEYTFWLNPLVVNPMEPTDAEIEHAKNALKRDFRVGYMENMSGFMAMMMIELNVAAPMLCCSARNVNEQKQSNRHALRNSVVSHIRSKLLADIEVYDYAKELHHEQAKAYGAMYTNAVELLKHPVFHREICHHDLEV